MDGWGGYVLSTIVISIFIVLASIESARISKCVLDNIDLPLYELVAHVCNIGTLDWNDFYDNARLINDYEQTHNLKLKGN